jgi:hypothetical protein
MYGIVFVRINDSFCLSNISFDKMKNRWVIMIKIVIMIIVVENDENKVVLSTSSIMNFKRGKIIYDSRMINITRFLMT